MSADKGTEKAALVPPVKENEPWIKLFQEFINEKIRDIKDPNKRKEAIGKAHAMLQGAVDIAVNRTGIRLAYEDRMKDGVFGTTSGNEKTTPANVSVGV